MIYLYNTKQPFCTVYCDITIQHKTKKLTFSKLKIIFFLILMSSTCFDPDDSTSGRRLYIQLCYVTFYMYRYRQSSR